MTDIIKVKAETYEELECVESDGNIYGYYNGKTNICAYIELGKQGSYKSHPNDDPKTTYKIFYNCNIYLAPTMEILESGGQVQPQIINRTVIIYY